MSIAIIKTDKIVEIIQVDRHLSIRSIGQEVGIDHKTVWNHSEKIGFQKELDVWVRHELTTQTSAKPGLTARKVLQCVWWHWKGIIHNELLNYGQTLNSVFYCEQLNRAKQAIDQKRPELANRNGVVFHHDFIRGG